MSGDIDIVITWVDGGDKAWLAEKARYAPLAADADDRPLRYRDWGLLRYLFRGIESFAPWARNVYLVTHGHLPPRLNLSHPRLRVARHSDFMPGEYLPTFSSHPIEWHLHRLPGLAEQFVYFNDDMFLTRRAKPSDFFVNGLPRDVAILNAVAPKDGFSFIAANNIRAVNARHSKRETLKAHRGKWFRLRYGAQLYRTFALLPWQDFTGFIDTHQPLPYLKSAFAEAWSENGDIIRKTCQNKFRGEGDVSIWLVRYNQLCKGAFCPARYRRGKAYWISSPQDAEAAARGIARQKYLTVCVNDGVPEADFARARAVVGSAFEKILPNVSAFETGEQPP
ncbi:MAG: Stealth CR1 domain-containing protein [Oscillospiraceae bacterium]|jgi:hypothetical protein|nr:Stealth CR1 domain-containing protein [Oscillospiraceae bacterium]